ncbi:MULTISPECIES: hypothetical protein [Clostridium]|uniref:Uncharacterized protein n=1 Tax=Clostridium aquiflavi TaxID=3073603 RepID=A0ABU1EF56_9CLOT|nr:MULTISPECIES: hypothetical protein [unclassified Clostridium]MDR5587022.1 hypothetical protein [Clostridium sp. 5N-1]NFG60486.1 hypothetical protein [Clostridium botulinum]NFQ09871.1 hypothetical protein [Clostridium botulinum]
MNKDYINALDAAKEYNLYLKVVTSVKSFDTYNSFFNIFDQYDDACRRIVVLTKYENLEEIYEEDPTQEVDSSKIIDGCIYLKSASLLTRPDKIDCSNMVVAKNLVEDLVNS